MSKTFHFFPGEGTQEAINKIKNDASRPVASFEKKNGTKKSSKKELKTKSTQVKTLK